MGVEFSFYWRRFFSFTSLRQLLLENGEAGVGLSLGVSLVVGGCWTKDTHALVGAEGLGALLDFMDR